MQPLAPLRSRASRIASLAFAVALVHCGGATTSSGRPEADGGAADGSPAAPQPGPAAGDAGRSDAGDPIARCADGGGSASRPGNRPGPVACAPSTSPAGVPIAACTTFADCEDAGTVFHGCLAQACSFDECLTDTDCPSGQACGCADQFGGNAIHYNACVPAQCRIDSDCGKGGICSPSGASYCGSLTGYYCHSPADTCTTDADCCDPTPRCFYAAALGHFACQAETVCGG